jgi:hypothetical protein
MKVFVAKGDNGSFFRDYLASIILWINDIWKSSVSTSNQPIKMVRSRSKPTQAARDTTRTRNLRSNKSKMCSDSDIDRPLHQKQCDQHVERNSAQGDIGSIEIIRKVHVSSFHLAWEMCKSDINR